MGTSAEGHFRLSKCGNSGYLKWRETPRNLVKRWINTILIKLGVKRPVFYHEFLLLNPENLSSIIHEISECEIHDILTKWKIQNVEIPVNGELSVNISHLISPYGYDPCMIPKGEYRANWGKQKKRK